MCTFEIITSLTWGSRCHQCEESEGSAVIHDLPYHDSLTPLQIQRLKKVFEKLRKHKQNLRQLFSPLTNKEMKNTLTYGGSIATTSNAMGE